MPMDGERLIIEPRFPNGAEIAKIGAPPKTEPEEGVTFVNRWWSRRLRAEVYVYEEDGKRKAATLPHHHRLSMELHTMGCSYAWGLEQEHNALKLLGTLVKHHIFKQYALTGTFLETSARSGLTYFFRRLRPTVVIDNRPGVESTRIVACLCAHPIGYYAETFAGAMTPTDDVVAHLMMMRGDEALFWKRSTQHPPWAPQAGL